ncbi:hypothetical protein [uncultured Pleomorphomonas sp.]|uniref:hypothetical protein n=1 Tax=uncultured Pleomorphomonas sp. TaxID=442121 RepID=UPI002589CAB7|nr:hypothetical protein [uncultured Pleomorphomonas sp.]
MFLTLLTTTGDHGDAAARADGEALSRWWGEADDHEDRFARAFAAYLLDGKALPAGPRLAFRRFRAWLIEAYLTMRGLGVAVAPEVGDVFDRLLATDAEIAAARRAAGDLGPVSADLGALRAAAEAEAEERLTQAIMRPVRAARQKWYRDGLAAATREAEGRIDALPVYRATEWLTNRRRLGDAPRPLPVLRLSRPILVERYGEAVLAALPRGRSTAYAAEGGVDPDEAAGLFGFSSGDEMIQAMALAPRRGATIAAEARRLMIERHGDPLVDGTLPEKALAAIHGGRMADWLAAELRALAGPAGEDRPLTAAAAQDFARAALAGTPVRDAVDARRHLAAERRAGEEAAKLSASGEEGERSKKLYDARRRQLLNLALYAEARRIADDLQAAERTVRRLDRPDRPEVTQGIDGWSAIDAILDRFEFRKPGDPAPRGAVAAFAKAMTAAGRENELALADAVLAGGEGRPYRELPAGELRAVVASLENIEHAMGRNDALVDARGRQSLSAAVAEAVAAVARAPGGAEGGTGARPVDPGRAAAELLREIAGDGAPSVRRLVASINAARQALGRRRQRAAADIAALYAPYAADERRAMGVRRFLPGLGRSLSRWEMIAIALNAGNEAGHARLAGGEAGLAPEAVPPILAALDGRDARFIAAVWDYLEGFRGEIAARERRATGGTPAWVGARPVTVGGVALKGGFYPLAGAGDLAAAVRAGRFAKATAMTGGGGGAGGGLSLDLAAFHAYVDRLLSDLELSEPLANAGRLIGQPALRDAFAGGGRAGDLETLAAFIDDAAAGDLRAGDFLERMAAAEMDDPAAERLARDLAAALVDAAGLAGAMAAAGADFAAGLGDTFAPGVSDRIAGRSGLMAGRRAAAAKRGDGGADALAGWLIGRARWQLADMPAWLSGYRRQLDRSGDEARAVAAGDDAARRADAGRAPGGKAAASVRTLVAALMASPAASNPANLSRALAAALLFARETAVLRAPGSGGDAGFGPIGAPAPASPDSAARAAMWAGLATSAGDRGDAKAVRSTMMAAALLTDAPPAVAIGHVFGAR